jgi:predicted dehydrogenase
MASQKRYRIAIAGCGGMGRVHVRELAGTPDMEVVALCDIFQPSLDRLGDEAGLDASHRYLEYNEMLDREKPDILIITTQAPQHAELTLAAAKRGIHVHCEKPLASDLAEGDAMVAACDKAGVRFSVNHSRRTAPAPKFARDLVGAGEIGDVLMVNIHEKGGRPLGNMIMEMGTHYFDMARFVLSQTSLSDGRKGDQAEWVMAHLATGSGAEAHASTPDEIVNSRVAVPTDRDCGWVLGQRGTVMIGFAGEVPAIAQFLNLPKSNSQYDGVDVIGTKGSIAVRGARDNTIFRRQGHTFASHDPWVEIPVPNDPAYAIDYAEPRGMLLCRGMVRDLISAIEEERAPTSSGYDGLAALELIMATYESYRQNRPVPLPLAVRHHPLDLWREELLQKQQPSLT